MEIKHAWLDIVALGDKRIIIARWLVAGWIENMLGGWTLQLGGWTIIAHNIKIKLGGWRVKAGGPTPSSLMVNGK